MCAPSPPSAKSAQAAAQAQGQANVDAAIATAQLNNPNVITPYGTQTVTYGNAAGGAPPPTGGGTQQPGGWFPPIPFEGGGGRGGGRGGRGGTPIPGAGGPNPFGGNLNYSGLIPTVTQKFSPEQQKLYEQQTAVKQALGGLGLQGANALKDLLGTNVDFSGAPQAPGSYDSMRQNTINAMMGRANQGFKEREADTRSQLIAQGIRPGTEAYTREMTRIDQARNDARQQADIAGGAEASRAYAMDSDRRRTAISELLAQRQIPLNEITALTSGSQVQNPFSQVSGYQGGAMVQPAPMTLPFQNQMNSYNARAASQGNMMSGLFGLGSAAILA